MLNNNTGKELKRNKDGQEIFKCPKCKKIHIITGYVYAQMYGDVIIHTCVCGTQTKFYRNVMYQAKGSD